MLSKNSISIIDFAKSHNKKIKRKISQKDLIKNLNQLNKLKDIEIELSEGNINYILLCVVEGINFGKIKFKFDLLRIDCNIREAEKEIKSFGYDNPDDLEESYASEVTDYIYCEKVDNELKIQIIAPHIAYNNACFGGFVLPIIYSIKVADYAGIGILLQNYIKSMNKKSHNYTDAVEEILKSCDFCGEIIKPYQYKTLENLNSDSICKKCQKQ